MSKTNKMSLGQLTLVTAVNMIGAGIIMLPSQLAQVGAVSVFAWIISTVGAMSLAYAFAKCGLYSKKGGGLGGYAEYSFGKSGNFLVNFTYAISLIIANVAIAISIIGYVSEFMGIQLSPIMTAVSTIAVLWICTSGNFGGARLTGILSGDSFFGVLIPILVLIVAGIFFFSGDTYMANWNVQSLPVSQTITDSIAVTIWGLLGMESACANMDAVENPEKNVPLAVLGGTVLAAIINISSTSIIFGIVPDSELAASTALFGLVFARMFSPLVGQLINACFIVACVGSLCGWQFTVANVVRDSARAGFFPKFLIKSIPNGTPMAALISLTLVQTVMALMTISPSLNEQFMILLTLAVVTNLIPFFLSIGSLPRIMRLAGCEGRERILANMAVVIASVYSLYACYASGSDAMVYGSLLTFAGWVIYGMMDRNDRQTIE